MHSEKKMEDSKGIPVSEGCSSRRTWIPVRYILVLLGIYSSALVYTQRIAISVGIVAMVKLNRPDDEGETHACAANSTSGMTYDSLDFLPTFLDFISASPSSTYSEHINSNATTYDWNESMQGIVLGAHYWFYTFAPTIFGRLCDKFGGKWISAFGAIGSLSMTLITPVVVEWLGVGGLIAVRVLMGLSHGCVYAPLFILFVRWFPIHERATANATMFFGGSCGAAFMSTVAGWLSGTYTGWPLVFYANALMYVPFILLWIYYVAEFPEDSKHISEGELKYIRKYLPPAPSSQNKQKPAPWSSILLSRAVICSSITKMCSSYGFYLLIAKIPSYLSTVFGLSLLSNGNIYAAMNLGQGLVSLLTGPFSNWVIAKTGARSIVIRKLFQVMATSGPALCLAMIPIAGCNSGVVIVCLMLSLCTYGMLPGGEWTTISEYAPNNSGVIFGITNFWGVVAGVVGPYIVGLILGDDPTQHLARWNIVFYSTAAVFVMSGLTFSLMGTDQPQAWDSPPQEDIEDGKAGKESLKEPKELTLRDADYLRDRRTRSFANSISY